MSPPRHASSPRPRNVAAHDPGQISEARSRKHSKTTPKISFPSSLPFIPDHSTTNPPPAMSATSLHPSGSSAFRSSRPPSASSSSSQHSPSSSSSSSSSVAQQKDITVANHHHWAALKRNSAPDPHFSHPPPSSSSSSSSSSSLPGPARHSLPSIAAAAGKTQSVSPPLVQTPNGVNGGMNSAALDARKKEEQRKLAIKNAFQESQRFDGTFAVNDDSIYFNFILPVLPSFPFDSPPL